MRYSDRSRDPTPEFVFKSWFGFEMTEIGRLQDSANATISKYHMADNVVQQLYDAYIDI